PQLAAMKRQDLTSVRDASSGSSPRRSIGPRDDWSRASSWPEETAAAVDLERKLEVMHALPKLNLYAGDLESQVLSALDRMENIAPRDAMESMLAAQTVCTHSALERFPHELTR